MVRQGLSRQVQIYVCVVFAVAITPVFSTLSVDFYSQTCPNLTNIVRDAMNEANDNDPVNLPAVLRLFAHDAFVNGVDGSVLLDTVSSTNKAEKDASPNLSLFGFDAIENAKFQVEEQCPGVVSCADILTLCAQIAVELTGGPIYDSELGRRDSRVSKIADAIAQLPNEKMNMSQLTANFASKGLTTDDLVALSGAHTIGFAHCKSFSYRIYNFNSTTQFDPSLDPTLADQLRDVCSRYPDPNTVQALDIDTITTFDEQYYGNLQIAEGMLQSDQVIGDSPITSDLVNTFASNRSAFFQAFIDSMIKFGRYGVLTGTQGEIRNACNLVN